VYLESKNPGGLENAIIEFLVLESMQRVMMDKILQCLLGGEIVFQLMNHFIRVKWLLHKFYL